MAKAVACWSRIIGFLNVRYGTWIYNSTIQIRWHGAFITFIHTRQDILLHCALCKGCPIAIFFPIFRPIVFADLVVISWFELLLFTPLFRLCHLFYIAWSSTSPLCSPFRLGKNLLISCERLFKASWICSNKHLIARCMQLILDTICKRKAGIRYFS